MAVLPYQTTPPLPVFAPLISANLSTAMRLREKLYLHEDLVYSSGGVEDLMRDLMAHPEYGALWLIEAGGVAVGYVLLTLCYSLEFQGRFGLLDELYIEDDARGQGLGGATIAFILEQCRARGLKAVRLEVSHANPRAQELYRRNGFSTESRHLMTKWI